MPGECGATRTNLIGVLHFGQDGCARDAIELGVAVGWDTDDILPPFLSGGSATVSQPPTPGTGPLPVIAHLALLNGCCVSNRDSAPSLTEVTFAPGKTKPRTTHTWNSPGPSWKPSVGTAAFQFRNAWMEWWVPDPSSASTRDGGKPSFIMGVRQGLARRNDRAEHEKPKRGKHKQAHGYGSYVLLPDHSIGPKPAWLYFVARRRMSALGH